MRRKHSIFTLLSVLPVSLFGYFDGFKTDYSVWEDPLEPETSDEIILRLKEYVVWCGVS